jgi:hypothetical protein
VIIHDVAQGSPEWFSLRAGLPTASEAKKLVTGTGKPSTSVTEYAYQLAGELYAGKPLDGFEGNVHTDRGKELEPLALDAYSLATGSWITQVGFCTNDEGAYGCSPDGLVDDDGMVELKCLMAKNHVKAMVYYNKNKACMPDYIPQCQMQMLVCGRKWCDLVFYHPDLPILVIRQEADFQLQGMLLKQLVTCLETRDNTLEVIKGRA